MLKNQVVPSSLQSNFNIVAPIFTSEAGRGMVQT